MKEWGTSSVEGVKNPATDTTKAESYFHFVGDMTLTFRKVTERSLKGFFLCGCCDRGFLEVEAFEDHMITFHWHQGRLEDINKCYYCRVTFTDRAELRKHVWSSHSDNSGSKIFFDENSKLPGRKVVTETSAERRQKRFLRPSSPRFQLCVQPHFSCYHCLRTFNSKRLIKKHIITYHFKPHFENQCTLCDKSYPSKSTLSKHIRAIHLKRRFACPICQMQFTESHNLKVHISNVHEKRRDWVCEVCQKRFSTRTHMVKHISNVHERNWDFVCEICFHGFFKRFELLRHIEGHTKWSSFVCPRCHFGFSSQKWLDKHVEMFHEKKSLTGKTGIVKMANP